MFRAFKTMLIYYVTFKVLTKYFKSTSFQNFLNFLDEPEYFSHRKIKQSNITYKDFICKICLKNKINIITDPCGHVLCYSCCVELQKYSKDCSMCRETRVSYKSIIF